MLALVVSGNIHNEQEEDYAAVLVTADHDAPAGLPSWVRLNAGDPAFGYAVCSYVNMVHKDELREDLGEITMETQLGVDRAIRRMFAL